MGDSIRSLTVKLGYDVDTTGANIFRNSFKNLKGDLSKGAGLAGFEKKFIDNLQQSGNRINSRAKKIFAVVAATIAASVAAATKVFKKFATIETARGALQFRAGGQFGETINQIDKAREETGNLVSELDALNAFKLGSDITGDFQFLAENFSTVIKLSKILGSDIGETQRVFATFVQTGSNLQELVKFGFISPQQLDALKRAGTDFSKLGVEARKGILRGKIEERKPEIDVSFERFRERSQATIDRLSTATEDTVVIVGEKLNPALNKFAKALTIDVENIQKAIRKGGPKTSILEDVTTGFGQLKTAITTGSLDPLRTPGLSQSSITDNSTTVINVSGADDPEVVARKVEAKIAKKVIQSSLRRETPQALNTTIQPSINQ